MDSDPVIRESLMRKKGSVVNMWSERYFILRSSGLYYYMKASDKEPKGLFKLEKTCKVSEIRTDVSRKRTQFVFKVAWIAEPEPEDSTSIVDAKGDKKRFLTKKRVQQDSKDSGLSTGKMAMALGGVTLGAVTTGIGAISGMALVGAASGTGENPTSHVGKNEKKDKSLTLACDSYADAEKWIVALQGELKRLGGSADLVSNDFISDAIPPLEIRLEDVENWIHSSNWRVRKIVHGIRLFEQIDDESSPFSLDRMRGVTSKSSGKAPVCLRAMLPMNAPASDVFMTLMNMPPSCRTGVVNTFRIVESLSHYADVVHITLDPVYIFPSWTAPRDLCVLRYWKQNIDGSYIICWDSTTHVDCPLMLGYVRAEIHAAYAIAGPKEVPIDNGTDDNLESLVAFFVQYEPRGWLWEIGGYKHVLNEILTMHIIDVRDAIDSERFTQVQFDAALERNVGRLLQEKKNSANSPQGSIATIPPPQCDQKFWSEVDPSTFRVRGKNYNSDKLKEPSAPSIFKLICCDLFESPELIRNVAADPRNRVYQAHQRGETTWVFVVNFMIPGPPNQNFIAYFEGSREAIAADTPFGRIARPFFTGNDDEFRNNRFKLIPKIVEGNMVVKMAVKDTPTLIGNKLKQYYFKGDNYFELDIDVASSQVARNLTGLAIGYSKAIIIDLGMCLQGNDENELPEVLMGGVTCIHIDMSTAKKM